MQMHIQFMYHGDITWDYEKKSISILLSNMHQPVHVYIFHKGWFITKEFLKFIYLTLYVQRHFYLCVFKKYNA